MEKFIKTINKLLTEIRSGKKSSFKKLYDLTYVRLSFIAYRYLKNKIDCEDLVAEVYFLVYKYIHAFDETKNGYSWICKILQNTAYNFNAKYHQTEQLNDNFIDTDDIIDKTVTKCYVDALLDKLSEEEKEIIVLKFIEDKTLDFISKKTGFTINQINNKIIKIIKKIKNFSKTEKN